MWKILCVVLLFTCGTASAQLVQAVVAGTPAPATVNITVVQHKSTHCVAVTCALAFTSNVGAGDTLIYFVAANSATLNLTQDNNSNTIANAINQTHGPGYSRVDYVTAANAGATTVTAESSGTTRTYISIWEVSGLPSGVPDQTNSGTQTGTSQSISTSSTTTAANEIVFGFFLDQPNDDSWTPGAGFSPSETIDGGSGNESVLVESMVVSTTGTQTATATCGSGTNQINQVIATFK